MIDLQQLQAFVVLCEELHFGRAAARLNVTQPPLTRQIQALEKSVGIQLLQRTTKSVQLTPAGRIFLRQARRLLAEAELLVADAQRAAVGDIGRLRLGFTAGSGYQFLPSLLADIRPSIEGIDLILREMVSLRQFQALATDRLDLGLVRPPIDHGQFASRCLHREQLVVALSPEHALDRRENVRPADLENERIVMYSPYEAAYFYNLVTIILHAYSIKVHFVQYVTQIHSILALVRSNFGIALVPESARILGETSLTFRPLLEAGGASTELFLAWRRDDDNAALHRFLEAAVRSAVTTA